LVQRDRIRPRRRSSGRAGGLARQSKKGGGDRRALASMHEAVNDSSAAGGPDEPAKRLLRSTRGSRDELSAGFADCSTLVRSPIRRCGGTRWRRSRLDVEASSTRGQSLARLQRDLRRSAHCPRNSCRSGYPAGVDSGPERISQRAAIVAMRHFGQAVRWLACRMSRHRKGAMASVASAEELRLSEANRRALATCETAAAIDAPVTLNFHPDRTLADGRSVAAAA
jgi:hypothetical protein